MHRYIKAVGAGQKRARALDRDEARAAMSLIVDGQAEPLQVGAFLLALRMKGETPLEMAGFCDALDAHTPHVRLLDGTLAVDAHGDGHEGVLSLLPAAACAVAACGVPVWLDVDLGSPYARHGLDGGLHAIGFSPDAWVDPASAAESLARRGIGVCDLARACAPLHRLVALRPLLGVRTLAQTLAKLVSPSRARRRAVGAFHAPYLEPIAAALGLVAAGESGEPLRGLVVQSLGGLPEARPGKLVRVAYTGEARARSIDLHALHALDGAVLPTAPANATRAELDAAAASANRAALEGDVALASIAAATAGVLLHAATGADPVAAAGEAAQALACGAARARAS